MKFRIYYTSKYRNDVLDWHEDIRTANNENAVAEAKRFIADLNEKAQKERTFKSFKLVGVSRVIKVRRVIYENAFTPIDIS